MRLWLRAEKATSHYLKKEWPILITHVNATRPRWANHIHTPHMPPVTETYIWIYQQFCLYNWFSTDMKIAGHVLPINTNRPVERFNYHYWRYMWRMMLVSYTLAANLLESWIFLMNFLSQFVINKVIHNSSADIVSFLALLSLIIDCQFSLF